MAFKALEDAIETLKKRLGGVEARTSELDSRAAALETVTDREQWRGVNAPAFLARGTGTTAKSGAASTTVFPFNVELLDNRANYNPATYRFTAPVDGVYSISVSLTSTTTTGGPEFSIFKNGSVHLQNAAIGYTVSYNTFSVTIPMKLVAGDYIEVRWTNNNGVSATIDGTRSTFSGHLIN